MVLGGCVMIGWELQVVVVEMYKMVMSLRLILDGLNECDDTVLS